MSTLDEIISGAVLPERTVRLCLRGDLTGALEQAQAELAAAKSVIPTSLSGGTGVPAARAKVDQLQAQVDDAAVEFKLRGVTSRTWADLVAENPPREDNTGDATFGYNTDALFAALVSRCLVEPTVTPEQVDSLIDALSAGQWDLLVEAAIAVSRRKVDVPFSPPASPPTEVSD